MQWVTTKKELINSRSNVANAKATTCFSYILTICTPRHTIDKGYGNLAASIGSTMKPFISIILIKLFHPSKGSTVLECLGFPCHGWDVVNNRIRSCKSLDEPAKQARMLTGGFELKYSCHAQETH